MQQNVVEANRERDLYLLQDLGSVIFIPQGWCDSFCYANGCCGGPDPRTEDDGEPDLYGYSALESYALMPSGREIATLWHPVQYLQKMLELTEEQAKEVHPELFDHLIRVNNE